MNYTNVDTNEPVMLTTVDNPFNPFTNYSEWYAFDVAKGYHTCGYLARIAHSSDELSDASQAYEISQAIDEIVTLNVSGIYIKVTEKGFIDRTVADK